MEISPKFSELNENEKVQVTSVLTFLSAYSTKVVRSALKQKSMSEKEARELNGWKLWTGEGIPPKPYEYTMFNELWYYREPLTAEQRNTVVAASVFRKTSSSKSQTEAKTKICPDCGAQAFAQAVCPRCLKGKAGIRRMWICGENENHVFYTE